MAIIPWHPTMEPSLFSLIDPSDLSTVTDVGGLVTQVDDVRGIGNGPSFAQLSAGKQYLYGTAHKYNNKQYLSVVGITDDAVMDNNALNIPFEEPLSAISLFVSGDVNGTAQIRYGDNTNDNFLRIRSKRQDIGLTLNTVNNRYLFGSSTSFLLQSHTLIKPNALMANMTTRLNGDPAVLEPRTEDFTGKTIESIEFGSRQTTTITDPMGLFGLMYFTTTDLAVLQRAEGWLHHGWGEEGLLGVSHPYKEGIPLVDTGAGHMIHGLGLGLGLTKGSENRYLSSADMPLYFHDGDHDGDHD